jgi:arylsulfatase A-like enzyme
MSASLDDRAAWLQRVLGFTLPAAAGQAAPGQAAAAATPAAAAGWQAARRAWDAASESVDGQIAGLQAALRQTGDDTLVEIAEFGLNGITGNFRVPLMAALMEIGTGNPAAIQKTGPKALKVINDFRAHLDSSEAVKVCDGNPFGTPVSIRATLGGALAGLAASLEAGLRR